MKKKSIQKLLISTGLTSILTFGIAGSAHAAPPGNGCTLSSFNGPYVFSESGTIGGVGNDVEVGVFEADGAGGVMGHGIMNVVPLGVLEAVFTGGTYTIGTDCLGSATFTATLYTTENTNLAAFGLPVGTPVGTPLSSTERSLAFGLQKAGNAVFIGLALGDSLSGSAIQNTSSSSD